MTIYTTYDTVGIKEDVSDVISNVSPTKTPFTAMIGTDSTKNRQFQWLEDTLADPTMNAQVEGADASDMTITPPNMRNNVTQIFSKSFGISATEDAVDQHGRAKETAYQVIKRGKELKRDKELAYIGVDQAQVFTNSATARHTASATKMVDSSVTIDGAAGHLTEAMILSAGQAGFTAGSDPSYLMIKPADSLIVAGFTGAAGRYREMTGDTKKLVNAVELYVSPFGELKVVLNRQLLSTVAWLLDPEMWKDVTLRSWTREPLAKTGDSQRQLLVGEYGLKNTNYKSSPLIKNII